MALVDTYDRNKPLEKQVDFPIEAEGLELIIEANGNGKSNFILNQNGQSNRLTETEAKFMAILMKDGFATTEELYGTLFDNEDVSSDLVRSHIGRLREKIEGDIIKNLSSLENSSGGYYMGELSNHRNQGEHVKKYHGYVLNTLTRNLQLPDGKKVNLSGNQTKIMETLFRLDGFATIDELYESLSKQEGDPTLVVYNHIVPLRQKMGKTTIKNLRSSKNHPGGYYMNELSQCRNEGGHVKKYDCYVLNTLTRNLQLPDGKKVNLSGNQTKIMETLIKYKGRASRSSLAFNLYGIAGSKEFNYLNHGVNDLNGILEGNFVVLTQGIYTLKK